MHDPSTVAHEINIPLPWREKYSVFKDQRKDWAKYRLLTIWHEDPEKDGTDDSCGWFKRSRHGDKAVLEKIVKRFEEDWDRVFNYREEDCLGEPIGPIKSTYFCGLFCPNGDPHMSVHAIVLNLFYSAAREHFHSDGLTNFRKARRFLRRNLFEILIFAENPFDSLFNTVTRKFESGHKETQNKRRERIQCLAELIYGWILRAEQPWYSHPRWHIHHWRFQIHLYQKFHRWAFERCSKCGGRFKLGTGSVCGDWSGKRIWHDGCDDSAKPSKESCQLNNEPT